MSRPTPETDEYTERDWWTLFRANEHSRKLERERDEARESLKHIEEYGTEEINAAVELRQKLASALVERDEALEALMKIEEVFIDSDDTYEALGKMGNIARAALESKKYDPLT